MRSKANRHAWCGGRGAGAGGGGGALVLVAVGAVDAVAAVLLLMLTLTVARCMTRRTASSFWCSVKSCLPMISWICGLVSGSCLGQNSASLVEVCAMLGLLSMLVEEVCCETAAAAAAAELFGCGVVAVVVVAVVVAGKPVAERT